MTKNELLRSVAAKTGFTLKSTKETLAALQETIFEALKEESVPICDGITVYSKYKESHEGRNPLTGETVIVPGHYIPKCKFGTAAKRALED